MVAKHCFYLLPKFLPGELSEYFVIIQHTKPKAKKKENKERLHFTYELVIITNMMYTWRYKV